MLVPSTAFAQDSPESAWELMGPVQWVAVGLTVIIVIGLCIADVIMPGSFTRAGKAGDLRDVSPQPWWSWFFGGLVVFCAGMFGFGLADQFLVGGDGGALRDEAVRLLAMYAVGGVAALGMVYLFHGLTPKGGFRFRSLDVPIGVGCFLLAVPPLVVIGALSTIGAYLWTGVVPPTVSHETFDLILANRDDPWVWGILAGAIIGAPLVEEVIYRGFVQSGIIRVVRSTWLGLVLASLLFMAGHIGSVAPHALPTLFFLAMFMGLAFERTGRIAVPITMHVCFNAANTALVMMTQGS